MSDWRERQLKDIFPISMPGEWGSEPDGINDFTVLRAADFTKDCKLRDEVGVPRKIPARKIRDRELVRGDILIEKSGGSPDQPVGRVVLFNKGEKGYSFSNFLQLLRVSEDCEPTWAYFLLVSLYETNVVLNYQQQTTGIINLKLEEYLFEKVKIPAKKSEQQKIAHILTTVDNLIEKTQSLIDKYTAVKQGMMHDLFTRGIDVATGQLRPSYEQAPQLYKETELGWMPREWGVKSSDLLCERICVGIVIQPSQYYVSEGVPAFRSANVREEGIDPNNFVYISPESNVLLTKSQIKAGDILSVRTGYPGTSAIVPDEFDGANCVDILISTPSKLINSYYLCEWINSSFGKEQILKKQGGMAQQHFNVGDMKELIVVVPSADEQAAIVQKIKSIKNKIKIEKNLLDKLILQKKGLMQDLLTGKVRVA